MKKTLTIVMAFLLTLSLLAACGGNGAGDVPQAPDDSGIIDDSSATQGAVENTEAENYTPQTEEKAISKTPDPSLPLIELGKGEAFEDDSIRAEFVNFEIIDIPALREGNFADMDPSYSRYMQFRFEITNKTGEKAKITVSDISVNETVFQERSYSYSDIDPNVVYNEYKIQFNKADNVELDPTEIETVRFHIFIYNADKGKGNYMDDPIYEGYLVFSTPQ